jgi:hypothetical protein
MGKFVIIPSHPSNDFFAQFPNCLTYANKEEFVGNLYYAMSHAPEPLTEEYAFELSWEAATKRLEAAGSIPEEEAEKMKEALSSDDASIEVRFKYTSIRSRQHTGFLTQPPFRSPYPLSLKVTKVEKVFRLP